MKGLIAFLKEGDYSWECDNRLKLGGLFSPSSIVVPYNYYDIRKMLNGFYVIPRWLVMHVLPQDKFVIPHVCQYLMHALP